MDTNVPVVRFRFQDPNIPEFFVVICQVAVVIIVVVAI